jgi:hypothetical protein
MKKNLSIIASLLLSAPLFADTLSDAFQNSKVSGEIKAAYVDSNFLGATDSDISAVGGKVGIVTGNFYGLKAGATFQASHVISDDITSVGNIKVDNFNASGAVMSEAYLEYTLSNTSLKAGRQFIQTPLLSSVIEGKSSESIMKDSFEAYVLTNTDLPNTTLVAGYVNKYQAPTDSNGNEGEFTDVEDGAYTIYLKNNSIENLTLQAQYLDVDGTTVANDKDALYFQADYKLGAQTLSAQYLTSSNGSNDGEVYGFKATGPLGIWKLGYLAAYNSNTKDQNNGDAYIGEGQGTTDTLFTAMPVHGGSVPSRADTDTIVGAIVIPAGPVTLIPYAGKSFSKTHPIGDVSALGTMLIYPIAKDLLFKAEFEHLNIEHTIPANSINEEDTDTTRVYLTYKF